MKTYKNKTVSYTERVPDEIVCDICGKKTKESWNGPSEQKEVEVSYTSVDLHPGGGWEEKLSFDICPECFKSKLIPWVESFGSKVTFKETVY